MAEKNVLFVDLHENLLTKEPNDYSGKVNITGTLRNAEIADRIVAKRTEFRKETIQTILDMADQEKVGALGEGKSLIDGVGQYLLSVNGVFVGEHATWDPHLHRFRVSYTPGKLLQEGLKRLTAQTRPAKLGANYQMLKEARMYVFPILLTVG